MKNLFIFGLGYAGQALVQAALNQEWTVAGTVRGAGRALTLAESGARVIALDPPSSYVPLAAALKDATHVVSTVPPDADGTDPILRDYGDLLRAAPKLQWAGYLSATSVSGEIAGGAVTELSPTWPATARGQARLAAERAWLSSGLPVEVFRLAGIYGPKMGNVSRNALASLAAGAARRYDAPGHVFNYIHVDDVAGALLAAIAHPHAGAIYNVSDGTPLPQRAGVEEAARLLGLAPPPLEPIATAALSPMQAGFFAGSKIVVSDKLRAATGWRPRYPSLIEGLRAIHESEYAGADPHRPTEDSHAPPT